LPKAASEAALLWRRVLPFALGAFVLATLAFVLNKRRGVRPKSGSGQTKQTTPAPETVTVALLCLALGGLTLGAGRAFAHGGKPDPAAAAGAAPSIALGQSSATVTARSVHVTLIARTSMATPDVLAPGEVKLPDQTAQLLKIKTAPVSVAQLTTSISINGQIAPNQSGVVRVASLVPGRVTRLNAKQGDRVSAGQVVAVIQSRAIGEAQSAFTQANARLQNASSNLRVVESQARAGVFSRAPLEVARRSQAEAAGDVRVQEAAVSTARVALDIVPRALEQLDPSYFGFCYDSSHDQIGGPRAFDSLESLGERLIAVHLSDRKRVFVDHVLPGEGFIDWQALTAAWRAASFAVPLLFEIATEHSQEKDPKRFLKMAFERVCGIADMIRP